MLSDKKLMAIDLMVEGAHFTDIEREVGVSHTQFWRWRNDLEFAAGLERARVAHHQRRSDKLWRVVDRAMDVALDALDEGDPQMARDLLKMTVVGLTDVKYLPSPRDDQAAPALEVASGHVCDECGKVCRSAAGLSSHQRAHAA